MHAYNLAEARRKLSDIVNEAAYGDEPTVIARRGKPLAVVMSVEMFDAYQELEDYFDLLEVKKRREAADEEGTLAWEDVREMGD